MRTHFEVKRLASRKTGGGWHSKTKLQRKSTNNENKNLRSFLTDTCTFTPLGICPSSAICKLVSCKTQQANLSMMMSAEGQK